MLEKSKLTKEYARDAWALVRSVITPRQFIRGIISFIIVIGGVTAALVTMLASRTGDFELARTAALASLVFVVLMVAFVVPPLMRSARAEAARLDFPMQLTRGGALFVGLLFIVTFAAWNTGNNLLYLIFAILIATLFVAWIAGNVALGDLIVSARFADHIFATEPAPVLVKLHNRKRFLPSFSVLVEARCKFEAEEKSKTFLRRLLEPRAREMKLPLAYFSYLPHRAYVEQRSERTFDKRGRLIVNGFEISTRFPFGFLRLRRRLRARNVELIVYPMPTPIDDSLHLLPIVGGLQTTLRRGTSGGHELYALRDYQPQDDLRHIDWKASARVRHLIVREFTAEDERRVHIALDTQLQVGDLRVEALNKKAKVKIEKEFARHEAEAIERFEKGVNLAASLIAHFIEERAEVRLTIGGETGNYGTGREHLYAALRRLAVAAPRKLNEDESNESRASQESTLFVSPRDEQHAILLTMQKPGTLPADIWRASHVIHL